MIEEQRIEKLKKKNRKNIIVGIDLSINCPGIAVINSNEDKVLYVDNYPNKNKKQCRYFRYIEIRLWLDNVIKMFRPELVIVEEAFMSSLTIRSNIPLLNIHGYVGYYLQSLGIDTYKVTPSNARSFLEIKPNSKEECYNWVCKKYPNLDFISFKKDNDKTDSIILARNYNNPKLRKIFEK